MSKLERKEEKKKLSEQRAGKMVTDQERRMRREKAEGEKKKTGKDMLRMKTEGEVSDDIVR